MENIDVNALSLENTDNRIELINGTQLACYPKPVVPAHYNEDKLTIDKSGEYLTIGSKPAVKKDTTEKDELIELFFTHAFLFYHNAHRILNDSRMFLAPVPMQNCMAYTGTSGFSRPTLGVYIEWWLNCESDITKDNEGMDALTCRFAGSPLSGSNHCTCVYPNGETAHIKHYPFGKVWSSFMEINKRYTKAKQMYQSYTLPEVVKILQNAGQSRESELETRLDITEGKVNILKKLYSNLAEQYNQLRDKYNEVAILLHKAELDEFRTEYQNRLHKAEQEIESLSKERSEYRAQMKQGLISNVEFQHTITPLTKRRKQLVYGLLSFKSEKTAALVKTGHLTYSQIESYINQ